MNTHSHFLMTALAGDQLKKRDVPLNNRAFLLGSVMPDIPLFALTLGYFVYRYWFDPIGPGEHIFGPRFDALYFTNPYWIAAHNFFHAPFIIGLMLAAGYVGMKRQKKWAAALFWFAAACGFHSLVDMVTHVNDGPLPFFPFNWTYRFAAPVSYWDPAHGGRIFAPLSLLLDVAIIGYFVIKWVSSRRQNRVTVKI